MRGEGQGLEDRLFLRTEAVLLAIVPALADDAMEAHELGVHRDVNKADRVKEFLAQRDELVKAVLAAVITFRAYIGMGSCAVGGRVGGAGSRPAIVAASRVVWARVISSCPPITRCVITQTCARAGREVRRGGIDGRSCFWIICRGHERSLEAPGLRVRPGNFG